MFGSSENVSAVALVFIAYLTTAKLGQYIYFTFDTSPALIWPPVGISIAAVILGGYRMCVPIFLAQFIAIAFRDLDNYAFALITAVAYALQAALALYVLRKLHFRPEIEKLGNMLSLCAVAFLVTIFEPTLATLAQYALGQLPGSIVLNIGRVWGAGIFSVLVITPFVVTWYGAKKLAYTSREKTEIAAAFVLLTLNNYVVFWTPYPQYFGIAVIFFLPAILIWFALRFPTRWMTLALLHTSVFGIMGAIIMQPSPNPLNEQLLSIEIYIGLVAAMFLVFVAVVEERRAAFARLTEAYHSTMAADRSKSEFIAILAHELRNPLAPIFSSLELLQLQNLPSDSQKIIENAKAHTVMIRRLLDDLLDTVRLSQKKFKLHEENVSLRAIVTQSVASVEDFMLERNQSFTLQIPDNDVTVYADPIRLKQILINLLNNACKYTEKGGAITLSAAIVADQLKLKVSDTGIGIDEDTIPSLFEPFTQAGATALRGTGLGIGLFLTKSLVEMHHGTITVESQGVGTGSTFTVSLPLPAQAAKPLAAPPDPSGSPTSRILIVDDNEAAANAMQMLLTHLGHEAFVAYSGKQALISLNASKPDLILLDLGMPEMDGFEVAREIRKRGWDGKMVALTGYGQVSDRVQSKEAGFDEHLVKPVGIDDILTVLVTVKPQDPRIM